jgi:phage-related protein
MATELGQAYVQIMPSAKGISGMIQKQLNPEADTAGRSVGSRIGTGMKVAVAASAAAAGAVMMKTISASLSEGSKLQQSLGGVETLFKGSANKLKAYANEAYKTSGLSANDYMENVTSFSASLLQSMGGNTSKAADKANMAMIDMSDNANKMGTNIGDIQNAYQGFAKQNYTMLDNLKLGYGGTQEEMKRLLKDATKITGVKYNMSNLSDVYSAIHAIQGKLNITGTTAREAATTFSGSFDSMKSAAQNVLGKLSLGMDVGPDLKALATTTSTFLFKNVIPMVGNIIKGIPGAVSEFIAAAGPDLMASGKQLLDSLMSGMSGGGDTSGIVASLNSIVNTVKSVLSSLDFSGFTAIGQQILPALQAGFTSFMSIAGPAIDGVVTAFGNLWNALQPIATTIASILVPAFQVLGAFLGGVFSAILSGISTAFNFLAGVLRFIQPAIDLLAQGFRAIAPAATVVASWIGKLVGLFGGMGGAASMLKSVAGAAFNGIKSAVSVAGSGISATGGIIKIIWSGLKTAATGLKGVVVAAWNLIKSGISVAGKGVTAAGNGIKTAWAGLKAAAGTLRAGISAAWSGVTGAVRVAKTTISGIVGSIKSIFAGLGHISLRGAGEAIMNGFVGGLKSVWEAGKKFVSGIANWIKEHKGPISKDAKLLIPAGNAIMGSLNNGLIAGFSYVKKNIGGMAGTLADLMSFDNFGSGQYSVVKQTVASSSTQPKPQVFTQSDDAGEDNRVIEIHVNAYLDKKQLTREIASPIRVELNRIDRTINRSKGIR